VRDRVDLPPQGRFQAEDEARRTVVQAVGALALLLTLWATMRRTTAAEETARASLETVKATIDGQINDRYIKAIELLGRQELQLRLGGIYALERIARDSKTDHWTVMEVLSALVRGESPRDDSKRGPVVSLVPQVALTVIARRDVSGEGARCLNLRMTNLGLAELQDAKLAGVDLSFADLSGSRLAGADLSGANLNSAILGSADLSNARLDHARMWGTHTTTAKLDAASLREVDLSGTILRDSSIRNANLNGAILAQFTESGTAYQWQVDIKGADLSFADLQAVAHWRGVTNWAHTNLFGVRNAPDGLLEWAKHCGAVAVEDQRQWWEAKMAARQGLGDDGH
jgi:uncharacterized protein YjbI with pentapeptide repeats